MSFFLKSVPGISTLTAMIFLTELADVSRFSFLDKLAVMQVWFRT